MIAGGNAETLLEAAGLTKRFGGIVAVNNVNLKVRRGTIHALIGPNGAGKTTCFNLLTKFMQPSAGTITFKGADITRLSPVAVAHRGLARSFQISSVFPRMTALENVRIALQRERGDSFYFWKSAKSLDVMNARAMEMLHRVGLADYAGTTAAELPYGRKRALEIATTLALDPDMLLLDEPMAGMASADIGLISELIHSLGRSHTILMVEHNLRVVADICDAITVLARGEVLAEGPYETVSADPRVQQAYMGVEHD
ncbi:ABC transporter ATP-binding protein [Actibacterium sp. D379-3]